MHERLNGEGPADLAPTLAPKDRFLRLADVVDLIGMRSSWITDRIRRGEFPRPIKIGHSAVWQESLVRAWMTEQIAKSQHASTT